MKPETRRAFEAAVLQFGPNALRWGDTEFARQMFADGITFGRRVEREALVKVAPLPTTADERWAKPLAKLVQASLAVVRDAHKQHDEHTPPHKYTAPFGAIATLAAVLEKHFPEQCAELIESSVKGE